MFSSDNKFDPVHRHKHHKIIILINNGTHTGKPDGIDASMTLLRDAANDKIKIPKNIILAVIPVFIILPVALTATVFQRLIKMDLKAMDFVEMHKILI
jgi:hypothetical protein